MPKKTVKLPASVEALGAAENFTRTEQGSLQLIKTIDYLQESCTNWHVWMLQYV